MKLHKIKNAGFTLVELMIVVAIIGVLASTLLPQLQGAQARARDAGRVASIKSIAGVLETYHADEGRFPQDNASTTSGDEASSGFANCLSNPDGKLTNPLLSGAFKGAQAPLNPQKTAKSGACAKEGIYGYNHLTKNGVPRGSYIVISDVEAFKKANLTVNSVSTFNDVNATGSNKTFKHVTDNANWSWGTPIKEASDAKTTVYAELY